ncbi:MAG: hypothetical protein J6Q07_00090 [Alistipes sp.]|nr:hypothetical protein [Alistipes sp.]
MIRANLKTGGSGMVIRGNLGSYAGVTQSTDIPTIAPYPYTNSSAYGQLWYDVTDYTNVHIDVSAIANGTASTFGKLIAYFDNVGTGGTSLGVTGAGTSPAIPSEWANGIDIDVSNHTSFYLAVASNNYSCITGVMTFS